MTSSNCLRSKPVPLPLLKGRNKNNLTCTEMVCQHLKDKLTGSPRLSPLHCKKPFLASYISTQLFYPAQELIYQWLQDLLHLGLTNLPYKESASDCSKSIPQSINTRPKKSMGGKKKKPTHPILSHFITSTHTVSTWSIIAMATMAPSAQLTGEQGRRHLSPVC